VHFWHFQLNHESPHVREPGFLLLRARRRSVDCEDDVAGVDHGVRMFKVNGGFRYPEDARKSLANPDPSPGQLLSNEYVERSRRMHANDVENIPLFLVAGLLYVCTSPSLWLAAGLFATYVVSRLGHFLVLLTQWSHEVRALFWTIGSFVVYLMAGAVIWHALAR
jgi:glutathione S-transferase